MYNWKESRIGLRGVRLRPANALLRDTIKNATNKMIALVDGDIRQIRHTGLPDEDGSNSNAACLLAPRKAQK
jgi:hypothetical protein